MSEHIRFSELEPGDPLDEAHLKVCEQCRHEWEIQRFLRRQIESTPGIAVSPFFSSRVAHLAFSSSSPLLIHLQKAARQLIPVFLTLILGTAVLLYQMTSSTPSVPGESVNYSTILFEDPNPGEISLDYVVNSLREISEAPEGDESN